MVIKRGPQGKLFSWGRFSLGRGVGANIICSVMGTSTNKWRMQIADIKYKYSRTLKRHWSEIK